MTLPLPHSLPARRLCLALPLLLLGGAARAQVLSEAVKKAASVDDALGAIGAKPQWSSHLVLDLPDVMLPGRARVRFASEIAGTAWLLLLRGRIGNKSPPLPAGATPEPALLAAQPFEAGQRARAELAVAIEGSQFLTLLALARGRWFYVEREVKVARPPAGHRPARG